MKLAGLSHSEIHGLTPACGSPWLIATCYVLHRLLAPRHSPNALSSLITKLTCRFPAESTGTQRTVICPKSMCSCQRTVEISNEWFSLAWLSVKLVDPSGNHSFEISKVVGVTGVEP